MSNKKVSKYETLRRVLLALPENLLSLTDEAASTLQMSRAAFIRQAIAMRVASFEKVEKPAMGNLLER